MNFMKIKCPDVANGPGVRASLFVSGCERRCPGCFNPESWSFDAGEPMTYRTYGKLWGMLSKPYVDGLSLLGGEPLSVRHLKAVNWLTGYAKNLYPDKSIWVWTGFTYETLRAFQTHMLPVREQRYLRGIMQNIDVLVDGPYIEAERDLTLQFRGSRNQRIIDVQKTRADGQLQLWEDPAMRRENAQQRLLDYVRGVQR